MRWSTARSVLAVAAACASTLASPAAAQAERAWRLPVDCPLDSARLTPIGAFGLERKARPGVPAHLHTGVDIARPSKNYSSEPVYPAANGVVISLRDDGPFAQLITEHRLQDSTVLWTVYEHIAGIRCGLGDSVSTGKPIARFMSRSELNRYGWQFDHVHLEVMMAPPLPRQTDAGLPSCRYKTHGLACRSRQELLSRYQDPLAFIRSRACQDGEKASR